MSDQLLKQFLSEAERAGVTHLNEKGLDTVEASTAAVQWPSSRDTARLEDMSPDGYLRVSLDNCGDVHVEVFNGQAFASVEFCTGAGGGGKSPRIRQALIALMVAIEADNKADVCGVRRHPRYGDIYT